MKICLFFGSFNPIHVGHLVIAQSILNETDVKEVWLVVSPHNPFKDKKSLLNEYDRQYIADLALQNNINIKTSPVEFKLPQPSYTIDTLTHLAAKYPKHQFSICMGADNLEGFHKWKKYEVILEHYTLYVYPRPNAKPIAEPHPNIIHFNAPVMEISSTQIRNLIKEKKSIQYLVPEPAHSYIISKGFYAN